MFVLMRRFIALVALVALGCEGPVGPAGQDGADATRLVFSGNLPSNGSVSVDLPPAAGTILDPPLFSCALLFVPGGVSTWVTVGTPGGDPDATCALSSPAGSTLRVTLSGGTPGQGYSIVVVY